MNDHDSIALEEPFVTALDQAVAFVRDRFRPAGVIVSGTIIRGAPDPTSDLDVAAVHDAPWRQRVQRHFNAVPAEIFVNSPGRLARTFAEEVASARPVMLHMIATGRIVFDPEGVMRQLQHTAARVLAEGPRPSAESLTLAHYGIVTALEDAEDLRHRDPDRAAAMLVVAVLDAARLYFRLGNAWMPREKELLRALDVAEPDLARLIRQVIAGDVLDARIIAARQAVHRIAGETRFFPWDSAPQPD
jgi:hypothetical protein